MDQYLPVMFVAIITWLTAKVQKCMFTFLISWILYKHCDLTQFKVPTRNCERVKILSHRNVSKQNPYDKLKEK